MPLEPLGKIPLMFLSNPAVEVGESAYDTLPWLDGPFRRLCGLEPLQGDTDDHEDNGVHEDTDRHNRENADQQKQRCADTANGFVLTKEAMDSLTSKQKGYFTIEARQKIDGFMSTVYKHALQLRRSRLNPGDLTDSKNRKPRKRARMTSQDSDEETFVNRVENIPCYKEFNQASLTMLNRKGGPIAQVVQIMNDMDRTPMIAWRNYVYTSQTMPSRAIKKLSPDELKEQMQKDVDVKKQELDLFNPPAIGKYLDDRLTTRVASILFGAAAFMQSSEILWDCYAKVTTALIRRAWERTTRDARKTLKKGIELKESYQKSLKEATENPCPRLLRKVSNDLKAWKDCAEVTGEAGEPAFAAESNSLEDLWEDLGYSVEPNLLDEGEKGSRSKRKKLRALATKEQMDIAYASYRERHFSDLDSILTELTEALEDVHTDDWDPTDDAEVNLLQGTEGRDLGVDHFARTSLHELTHLFGISRPGSLPLVTDQVKSTWHQFVGTGTILQRMFTNKLGGPPTPTLLCDDVGLGKTLQMLSTICMIIHFIELQDAGKSLPPLVSELSRPYFAGLKKIPRLPSVIVVPPTLIPQWEQQIARFVIHGSLQIITYASGTYNPVEFFQVGGIWEQHCKGKSCHRTLILVAISTIAKEARKYFGGRLNKGAASRAEMFRGVPIQLSPDLPTLLNRKFLFFGADEVHQFRNRGWAQLAGQEISANSIVRMGATATPIYTASRDALAAGRLLGYGPMIGDAGYELGMAMLESEKIRRKQLNKEAKAASKNDVQSLLDDTDASNDDLAKQISKIKAKKRHAFYIQQESIEMVREKLLFIMIRRTGRSRDPNGSPILEIEPYVESVVWAPPRKQMEAEAFRKHRQALMLCKSDGDGMEMRVNWKNFLIDDKKVTFHWMLSTWDPNTTPFWDEWTKENLEEMASTKILTAVEIVEHYQNPGAKPLFFNEDGTRDLDREERQVFRPAKKPRKVIIFVMYHVDRAMTKKALSVRGIESVEYDGRMSISSRDTAVHKFENDDNIRVLLMSNVGTTGLNLVAASVLIFLSCLWSGQEEKQTLGRSWRPGQLEDVVVHPVLVPGSADVVVSGLAGDKAYMLDYLYEAKTISQKVFNTYEDDGSEETSARSEDKATDTFNHRSKSKVAARPRKHPGKIEQTPTTVLEDPSPSKTMNAPKAISLASSSKQALSSPPSDAIPVRSGGMTGSRDTSVNTGAFQNAPTVINLSKSPAPPACSHSVGLESRVNTPPTPSLHPPSSSLWRPSTRCSSSRRSSSPPELGSLMNLSAPSSQLREAVASNPKSAPDEESSITSCNGNSAIEPPHLSSGPTSPAYSNSGLPPWKRKSDKHKGQAKPNSSASRVQVDSIQRASTSSASNTSIMLSSTRSARPTVSLSIGTAPRSSTQQKPLTADASAHPPGQFRRKMPTKGPLIGQGAITGKRIARSPPPLKRSAVSTSLRQSDNSFSSTKGKKREDTLGDNSTA